MVKFGNSKTLLLRSGKTNLMVKKEEAFIFYATFIADEYKLLNIRENDIIIDFGANIGDFTFKVGRLLHNTGKIIAIVPNHNNVEILKKNLELNNIKNVKIIECAITDKNSYSYLKGDDVGAEVSDIEGGTRVKTISIENLLDILDHPKNIVVKMDIEGGEKYIFTNDEFVDSIREIAVELQGKENIGTIPKILEANNFIIRKYETKDEIKNTIKFALLHPLIFIRAEKLSGYIAINGAISTLKNKTNPIPSINNDELEVIYACRRDK